MDYASCYDASLAPLSRGQFHSPTYLWFWNKILTVHRSGCVHQKTALSFVEVAPMRVGNSLLQNLSKVFLFFCFFPGFSGCTDMVSVLCSLPLRHPKHLACRHRKSSIRQDIACPSVHCLCKRLLLGFSVSSLLHSFNVSVKTETWKPGLWGKRYILRITDDQRSIDVNRRPRHSAPRFLRLQSLKTGWHSRIRI